jgi:hypothetical protein
LNDTIYKMDLADIYRVLYCTAIQYTFFLEAHGIYSKID